MDAEATVFVVDDDPGVLKSMRWLLEAFGFEVKTYESAEGILDDYDPERPGCLILDLCMPGMNGLQLQEKLVEDGVGLPIVFVTGHADVPASVRAMKQGAIDFLEKPVSDEELSGLVREAVEKDLERRRVEREQLQIRSRLESLTLRQREVMRMLVDGIPSKQIAASLGISNQTAAKHRTKVLNKLDVSSEAELVRLLMDNSLQLT
jgi:FixJ family two-component response regulator